MGYMSVTIHYNILFSRDTITWDSMELHSNDIIHSGGYCNLNFWIGMILEYSSFSVN